MSTGTDKQIMTPAEYREKGEQIQNIIRAYPLTLEGIIEDYPIGRGDRGMCKLGVERAKGKGYRTVRTTTDRNGRWCKPHKSTYRNGVIVVVNDLGGDRSIRWLAAAETAVYLQAANGDTSTLIKAPHYCKPQREERKVRWKTTRVMDMATMEGQVVDESESVFAADPPELCDAWDAWMEEYRAIHSMLFRVWE